MRFALYLFPFLFGCVKPQSTRLTILHTNDHHGRFWPNENGEYGLAARKTLIDSLRIQAEKQNSVVLLLSGGDINTGVPESDMQQAEPDFKGMSILGYDAMALGNHEFDNPLGILEQQQKWANFPLLSANIFDQGEEDPKFQPYAIIEKKGLVFAVIGLTTVDTYKIGNPEYISHLLFQDPVPVMKKLIPEIKSKYKPDMIIAVTHMGHYDDANHGVNAPGDVTLARGLQPGELHAIIGGHSQEPLCMEAANKRKETHQPGDECQPDRQNGTWIMQAYEWGKYVGKAEFRLKKGVWELTSYELIPVNLRQKITSANGEEKLVLFGENIEPDPSLQAFLAPYQQKGQEKVNQPIGEAVGFFDGTRESVRFVQTNLGRLIGAAQSSYAKADFGIIGGGGIRDSIPSGPITLKDILKVHPFGNKLSYVEMKGEELIDYLSAVASFPTDTGGFCQFYGVSLELNNGRAQNIQIQGEPLDMNRLYRFSLNSYSASGGDGYPNILNHPTFIRTDFTDAEILRTYIERNTPIDASKFMPNDEIKYETE